MQYGRLQWRWAKPWRPTAMQCYNHLRRIRQIQRYVDDDCWRHLVHAFITSRLDHCNSMYARRSATTLKKTPTRPKLRRKLFNAPPRSPTLNNCTGCPSRGEYNTNYAASCSELTENYSTVLPFPVLCHRQPPPIDCKGTLHHSLEWPKDARRTHRLRSQVQLVLGTVCHIHSPRVPNLPILLMPTEKLPFNARCYAERGITMACLPSVCLSVRLRRWWTGVWSHRLEFFENNFMVS